MMKSVHVAADLPSAKGQKREFTIETRPKRRGAEEFPKKHSGSRLPDIDHFDVEPRLAPADPNSTEPVPSTTKSMAGVRGDLQE